MIKNEYLKRILFFILTALVIASCNPYRKLNILQEAKTAKDSSNYEQLKALRKLEPGDVLNVKFYDIQSGGEANFSPASEGGNFNNPAAVFINGYVINDSGYVALPSIGRIYVQGQTIIEARKSIQKRVETMIRGALVSVKLVNYRFTVLGDVNMPGVYYSYNDYINILEALGMAGGFSEFANSTRIKLIRKVGKNSIVYYLDLSTEEALRSTKFYILPNDIIYVEPLKTKSVNLTLKQIGPILSAVGAAASIINITLLIINNSKK